MGDKDNGSRQKHVRFPMPASAANAYMPPRGEFKGSVVAVTREDWIVSCSLEPAQTLKIKVSARYCIAMSLGLVGSNFSVSLSLCLAEQSGPSQALRDGSAEAPRDVSRRLDLSPPPASLLPCLCQFPRWL